jgi:HAD superfamily hydrolase (TIGR01509 family)
VVEAPGAGPLGWLGRREIPRGWCPVVTAVLFDLFETLVTEAGTEPTRASSLGPLLGLDEHAFRNEWKRWRPGVESGQLSFRRALREIARRLGGRVDEAAIRRSCQRRSAEKAAVFVRTDRDVADMVNALHAQGHRLAVVSNCFAEDVRAWPTWVLAPKFCCAVFSYEVRVAKPDPEIYLAATRRLGVDPESAVFIGDGGNDELSGAERAGLRSFRAGWFVGSRPHTIPLPRERQLETCADVIRVVAGSE